MNQDNSRVIKHPNVTMVTTEDCFPLFGAPGLLRLFTRVSHLGSESDQVASLSLHSRWPVIPAELRVPFSQGCKTLQQVSNLPPVSASEIAAEAHAGLGRSLETHLVDIVVNVNHILIVVESLDEVSSLLQLRPSQLHLRVGDEL